jgi:hypothetical protein
MQNLTIQLCRGPPVSTPSLFPAGNVCGARRLRAPRSGCCRAPPAGRGQAPRRRPAPHGTPTAGPPPSPSLFPSLPRRRPAVFKPRLRLRSLLHHPLLSGPPLERRTSPNRSPHPDHRLRPLEALPRSNSDRAPPPSAIPR